MLKNYLKIAWRNLFRNKGFSITNVVGLTIGMTCTIFILLWVQDELSFDKFNKNYSTTYQVMATRDFKNQVMTDPNMVLPLAPALEKGYPQIKNAVVTTYPEPHIFNYGDQQIKKTGLTVGGNFFDMFSFKGIKGNVSSVMNDPLSIALTQSTATSFFGKDEPIGKVLRIDNSTDMKVTAIVADPPGNSTIQFDFIKSFNFSDPDVKQQMNEWVNSSWKVYLQAAPGTKPETLEKIVNTVKKQHDLNDAISTYFVFPMNKWHLYSDFKNGKNVGGMIEYVRLFSIIAIIILLVACVNFMNLSTARSEKRAKEVGVRKTLGSGKKQLIMQFYAESMILSFLAFIFSIAAVFLLLPSFNLLVGKQLALNIGQLNFWIGAAAIILFTGIIAGSYPALYLSSFNPVRVLKGTFLPGKKAMIPRRVLVVSQFVISILLISATIVVYQQIQHVKNRNLGYNPNNLIMIPSSEDIHKNYNIIRQELLNSGFISSVTRTFSPLTEIWWKSPSPDWPGKPANSNIIFTGFTADVDFTKTAGIKILMGKDFSGMPSDSLSIMFNKAAIDAMGIKDPIGMQVRYGKRTYTVTGVIENIVMDSPFSPVEPMMIYYKPDQANVVNIRLNDHIQPQKAFGAIGNVFKKYNPSVPFEYSFIDQEFEKKFITEKLISRLTNIFAGLAIFICCLGLAGLASFTIEKRIREIGIRKVVGASVGQILLLISKEFLRLVLLAFVIAVPLSWWAMNSWLQKYDYRVTITVWIFGFVGAAILLLTLGVVSLITIRAARANPVKSLRTE
ncbi:MAG: ABC transporter permease [Bacteroidetes bacterium]|nr:ABC transporter permease [Bacteroidota bacterium]MBS1930940.1 ABC transporter permease [Bacteroidota bacterium]